MFWFVWQVVLAASAKPTRNKSATKARTSNMIAAVERLLCNQRIKKERQRTNSER